ncbi:hypothetical protein [Sphingomonas sp. TREG-RG-20F-R18-01]|uniref:hypothetical protein n=1 Tax=Sphingomonas sp. TREG-RG-20F-R18-01 TaxID=2914982 RepID=UPI001F5848AC|nr:hypothetical protein [Sphingomonas sp. TREG-RG-20F-R18-01]
MTDEFDDLIGLLPDTRSEHAILNDVLMQCSALPRTFIYRQNTGQAWQGRPVDVPVGEYVRVTPGMKILAAARPIDFGIEGGGDAIGHRKGKAFQIETKALCGRQREAQKKFQAAWEQRGGIYILARDPRDAVNQLLSKT